LSDDGTRQQSFATRFKPLAPGMPFGAVGSLKTRSPWDGPPTVIFTLRPVQGEHGQRKIGAHQKNIHACRIEQFDVNTR
jgi:hypothetical protein